MPEIVISKPEPMPLSKEEFMNRFTFDEKLAIETESDNDPKLRVIKTSWVVAEKIDPEDPEIIKGIDYLVTKSLIEEARKEEILAL